MYLIEGPTRGQVSRHDQYLQFEFMLVRDARNHTGQLCKYAHNEEAALHPVKG